MTRQEKQQIEAALKAATDNTLKEQNIHRDRIEVMEERGNNDYLTKPIFINWNNINESMADECWPANHQDRKKLLKQNWDEMPSRILIDQIEDKDIAGRVYFLNEVVEHCHRIKALAKFIEVLNANGNRKFPMFDQLTAQLAYLMATYRQNPGFNKKLKEIINFYVKSKKSTRRNHYHGSEV